MTNPEQKQYRYFILTFGCQMNKNDSERLTSILEKMSLTPAQSEDDADIVIINSCSVRQSAEDRIFGVAKKLSERKKTNPELLVCVTGCMPGRDKDGKVGEKLRGVDLYFPTKDMVYLPQRLAELNPNLRNMLELEDDYLRLHPTHEQTYQAFVTLQTGCNHFCTYCVVPFARGLEVNRSLKSILDECHDLANKGCLEITLLGQIVNHYIAPDPQYFSPKNPYHEDFPKLLWELEQISGIERITFTAPHPIYMSDELLDAMTLPKHLHYLHLPVQSGNDEILRRMNRRHGRDFYIDLVQQKIRKKLPHIALATDIIVGFCGETDEQFQQTVDLYKACDFDISYTAQYSTRSGTLATKAFKDDVPKDIKKERWWTLQRLMEETVLRKNQQYVDQTVSVLVDSYENGWCTGNSKAMKRVRFKGNEAQKGTIQAVTIYKAKEWMLWGRPLTNG